MPLINAPPTYTNGHHAAANGHAVKDKPFPGPSETRPSLCVRPSQSRASTLTDERVHRLPKLVLKPWVSPAPAGLVLTNAQVIDPNAGKLLEGLQSVVIRDGKIAAVYPIDEPDLLAEEGSLRRVDVGGRYISPGLIDGHVHVTAVPGMHNLKEMCEAPPETISYRTTYVLREMLMRGFTTVRDTGKSAFFFFFCPVKEITELMRVYLAGGATKPLADAIAEGLFPGPRLFQCGKAISQTGGHGDFMPGKSGGEPGCCGGHSILLGRTADGVPQVLKATREELKAGAE